MTKKDFELIASVIQDMSAHNENNHTPSFGLEQRRRGERRRNSISVAEAFAFRLQATNPRFDRDRFLRACVPGANVRARA